ncbi:hypothetical protein TRFO_15587 [Tritrichomonas foetus]|uniref:Ion transport domain-containing protein n=1 Tax=Tritrichomonas foetus TaxID=1144522 RepID=A0A1J4KS35_9EUKA|nr:hypothetical protein TRFO_15587 [Tritrichomonas foetus]|eukprot:OHT14075.1 hypothetical protein TRFO_15587 [Tritrichomonas foetus]
MGKNDKVFESSIQQISDRERRIIFDRKNSAIKPFKIAAYSESLGILVFIASLLSVLGNAIYIISYLNSNSEYSLLVQLIDIFAFSVFSLEFIIKIVSDRQYYFYSWQNIFNLLFLLSLIFPFFSQDNLFELAYLSFFRIIHVTSFFRKYKPISSIEIVHKTISRNFISTIVLLFLLMIAIFLFSLIGYYCFSTSPLSPLSNLGQGIIILTAEATSGGWVPFQEQLDQVFKDSRIFSIIFIILGYVILSRAFVAFLADNAIVEYRKMVTRNEVENEENRINYESLDQHKMKIHFSIPLKINDETNEKIKGSNNNNNNGNNINQTNSHDEILTFGELTRHEIKPSKSNFPQVSKIQNEFNYWKPEKLDIEYEFKEIPKNEVPLYPILQVRIFPVNSDDDKSLLEHMPPYNRKQIRQLITGLKEYKTVMRKLISNESNDIKNVINSLKNSLDHGNFENIKSNKEKIFLISPWASDKKSSWVFIFPDHGYRSTDDLTFQISYRTISEINKRKLNLNKNNLLGQLNITMTASMYERKSMTEKHSQELSIFYTENIEKDEMLIKSGFWAKSLEVLLKDYFIHSKVMDYCYDKLFQRFLAMSDYLPVIKEIREKRKPKDKKK